MPWVRPNNIVVEAVAAVVEVEDAAGAEDLTVPRKVIMEIDHLHLPRKGLGAQITTVLQIYSSTTLPQTISILISLMMSSAMPSVDWPSRTRRPNF